MQKPIVIIHFQPLEMYPPVANLLTFIEEEYKQNPVIVVTTVNNAITDKCDFKNKNVSVKRVAGLNKTQPAYLRYFSYFLFYSRCLLLLIQKRPAAILYFETLSSFPAWFYKKFIFRNVPVFIHYHEYTSPAEYNTGMKLVRYFHAKEKWLYQKAAWISHTNNERLQFFLKDENLSETTPAHILPNYPPQNWYNKKERNKKFPVRIVYVGALDLDTMFTELFAKWVIAQEGKVTWDIYSNNLNDKTVQYIQGLHQKFIRLHKPVEYTRLPAVLKNYDVGVVLYNGHIPNYVFNAPNKLFEYLACDLDVWFPSVMKGCHPLITKNTYPKVVPVDFSEIISFDFIEARDITDCIYKRSDFYFENVLPVLTNKLFSQS
jgi:hypothetical protein